MFLNNPLENTKELHWPPEETVTLTFCVMFPSPRPPSPNFNAYRLNDPLKMVPGLKALHWEPEKTPTLTFCVIFLTPLPLF